MCDEKQFRIWQNIFFSTSHSLFGFKPNKTIRNTEKWSIRIVYVHIHIQHTRCLTSSWFMSSLFDLHDRRLVYLVNFFKKTLPKYAFCICIQRHTHANTVNEWIILKRSLSLAHCGMLVVVGVAVMLLFSPLTAAAADCRFCCVLSGTKR